MNGLVLKDLYSIQKYLKQYLLFFVVFAIVAVTTKMPSFVGFLGGFYGMSLFISTFNTDEIFQWEAYALTGPLSKRDLVKGKYTLMLLLMGGALALALVGELVICAVTKLSLAENLVAGFAMIIYIFFMISIVIPLIYKLGSEKARNCMILIFVVPSIVFVFIGKLVGNEKLNAFIENLNWLGVAAGAVILCIVAVIISYFVSIKIIEKKEF